MSSVPFIGLTGGLGAGKSTALAALEQLGAAVLSTDAVVHELYLDDEVCAAVVERFGAEMLDAERRIDRAALASAAFAAEPDRRWLEELLWPRVGARVVAWREQVAANTPPPPAAVVEVPLLFEADMDPLFDATIAVVAAEPLRSARASARGHAAIDERAARQLSQAEKADRADHVVINDGTLVELEAQLSALLDKMRAGSS